MIDIECGTSALVQMTMWYEALETATGWRRALYWLSTFGKPYVLNTRLAWITWLSRRKGSDVNFSPIKRCVLMNFYLISILSLIGAVLYGSFIFKSSGAYLEAVVSNEKGKLFFPLRLGTAPVDEPCIPVFFSEDRRSVYYDTPLLAAWMEESMKLLTHHDVKCVCPQLYGRKSCMISTQKMHFFNPSYTLVPPVLAFTESSILFDSRTSDKVKNQGYCQGEVDVVRHKAMIMGTQSTRTSEDGRSRIYRNGEIVSEQVTLSGDVAFCVQHCIDLMSGNTSFIKELFRERRVN